MGDASTYQQKHSLVLNQPFSIYFDCLSEMLQLNRGIYWMIHSVWRVKRLFVKRIGPIILANGAAIGPRALANVFIEHLFFFLSMRDRNEHWTTPVMLCRANSREYFVRRRTHAATSFSEMYNEKQYMEFVVHNWFDCHIRLAEDHSVAALSSRSYSIDS